MAEQDGGHRDRTFVSTADGAHVFLKAVQHHFRLKGDAAILDLGCGTGELTRALATAYPHAVIVGLDISVGGIRAAKSKGGNIAYVQADYFCWHDRPFEVVVADSVLHLLPGSSSRLGAKLAEDIVSGGLLIATMPFAGARNTLITLQRRLWRRMPKRADAFAIAIARRLYPHVGEDTLASRVAYLRILPSRLYDNALHTMLQHAGFERLEALAWPGPVMKPPHVLIVYRRI